MRRQSGRPSAGSGLVILSGLVRLSGLAILSVILPGLVILRLSCWVCSDLLLSCDLQCHGMPTTNHCCGTAGRPQDLAIGL